MQARAQYCRVSRLRSTLALCRARPPPWCHHGLLEHLRCDLDYPERGDAVICSVSLPGKIIKLQCGHLFISVNYLACSSTQVLFGREFYTTWLPFGWNFCIVWDLLITYRQLVKSAAGHCRYPLQTARSAASIPACCISTVLLHFGA